MHHRHWTEHTICTFKDHFLAILAGIDAAYPPYLRDLLLPQAELTINLLQQAMLTLGSVHGSSFRGPLTSTRRH